VLAHVFPRTVRPLVLLLLAAIVLVVVPRTVLADEPEAHGPSFGAGNIPTACAGDMVETLEDGSTNPQWWLQAGSQAVCHHLKTDLNALDAPEIDVLILVPASPAAERDMRIMRQSIEMWEAGIDYLGRQLALGWLAQGVNFHITVDVWDPVGGEGGEFTTYPVVDPEIVVIASNPVGGLGIGVDPIDFTSQIGTIMGLPFPSDGPCHGLTNPFDHEAWENVPGFDSHHESRSGTYVEDCGGAGGNVCFAVNGAIDPTPGQGPLGDVFSLFDLVSHEVGHCLTLGHVGDGAEGSWGRVPTNDIMAYDADPPGLNKCVSTLDVEGFAIRMSRFLDVDGDGAVTEADHLAANDQVGEGMAAPLDQPFQVQRPDEHHYASATGHPADCPQPDLGLVPGERTEWTPEDWPVDPETGRHVPPAGDWQAPEAS
jgi:hypothetical protein